MSLGENVYFFSTNQAAGQVINLPIGTVASPDAALAPIIKVSRTMKVLSDGGASDDGELLAAIVGNSLMLAGSVAQPVGVFGGARNQSAEAGVGSRRNDAVGVYGIARIEGSGVGVGIGAFLAGERQNTNAKAIAVELQVRNYGTDAEAYNSTGFSALSGAWITAVGDADASAAVVIGNPSGLQFEVGIGIPAQVAGGKTGGVATASFRDDGNAVTSIDIRGSRTYGIDLSNGIFSAAGIRLPNGSTGVGGIWAENAAGDGNVNVLYANSSNIIVFGGSAGVAGLWFDKDVTLAAGVDIAAATTTGTKIATAADQKLAFFGSTPIVKPTGVAVDAAGIHAALVSLGLIGA